MEVVYALPREQALVEVQLERDATLREAIQRSGLLERYPGIDLARDKVGVFGRLRALDEQAQEGDRVEIYRPLITEPKERRRSMASRPSRRA